MREDLICCWLTAKETFGPYFQIGYWRDWIFGLLASVLRGLLVFGVFALGGTPFLCSAAFLNSASRQNSNLLGVAMACLITSVIFAVFWVGMSFHLISKFQEIKRARRYME